MDSDSNLQFHVVDILSRLGVSSLSDYIGKKKLERFYDTGKIIDTSLLSEILYAEHGVNVFNDKFLRLELLASFGIEELKNKLYLEEPVSKSLKEYNDFSWGKNSKSKEFLQLFGINDTNIFDSKQSLIPIENFIIEKTLHKYQNWIRKNINIFFRDQIKRRIIVHMPTGSGKTRTMLEAVGDHIRAQENSNISVVWLAHSEELCDQAIESFKDIWARLATEEINIIRLWGGAKPVGLVINKPTFIVASFQTAYSFLSTGNDLYFSIFSLIRSNCSLMIVDEAHQSTAPTYKDAIELFSNNKTKVVGLTATPGRHHIGADEKETKKLAEFYENNKINILDDDGNELTDPINYLTKKGILANVQRFKIDSGTEIHLTESEIKHMERLLDIPVSVLEKLGKDAKRTNLIVTHAIKLAVEENYPTIIFAPSKDSAIEIATHLRLNDVNAASVTSVTPRNDRKKNIEKFKSGEIPVLVNYGVLTTGFDAPNIKAVIVARPTTSVVLYSQMIGRGLRGPKMGGESECYLLDVKDNLINMPEANHAFTYFDEYYNNKDKT